MRQYCCRVSRTSGVFLSRPKGRAAGEASYGQSSGNLTVSSFTHVGSEEVLLIQHVMHRREVLSTDSHRWNYT